MAATISTLLAIYFVLWWIVLFLTLPFGVRNRSETGAMAGEAIPGADPGAPVATLMARKALWTTIISAVIFAVALAAYRAGYFNIERLSKLMGIPL
jgi:predicted secreted protein